MHGLGDNIYQRSFVREIKDDVYLITSWPQLYKDLPNVYPVKPFMKLRTQRKNVLRQPSNIWSKRPNQSSRKIGYGGITLRNGSILKAMKMQFKTDAKIFDLPVFEKPLVGSKKYAVIRPVTVRKEWRNEARGPLSEYISIACEKLKKLGYKTVSIADLEDGEEWAIELPDCDLKFNNGELLFEDIMSLVQNASVVVGGVGWIVPASVAYGTPLITILGGHGAHNAPEKITGEPMNLKNVMWIYSDNYCMCSDILHRCNKKITDFESKLNTALESLCLTK